MNLLIVKALSMTTTGFGESGNRGLGGFSQSRSRADATSFVEMVNDRLGFRFTHFGVKHSRVASLREFFWTTAAAQQTNTVLAIDLANGEIALAWTSIMLAIRIHTG